MAVVEEVGRVVVSWPNTGSNAEVAKLQVFDRVSEKVLGFITIYKLFLRMRMRDDSVEEQIQWILSLDNENMLREVIVKIGLERIDT